MILLNFKCPSLSVGYREFFTDRILILVGRNAHRAERLCSTLQLSNANPSKLEQATSAGGHPQIREPEDDFSCSELGQAPAEYASPAKRSGTTLVHLLNWKSPRRVKHSCKDPFGFLTFQLLKFHVFYSVLHLQTDIWPG